MTFRVLLRGVERVLCGALFLGILLWAGRAWPDSAALMLRDAAGAPLLAMPVENGQVFAIRYVHSVAQSPVTDYFIIKNNEIWLDRTVYHDFGAGLPHAPEEGQIFEQKHGELLLKGYDQRLASFELRVGRLANHALLLFGKRKDLEPEDWEPEEIIPLKTLAKPGAAITFSVERMKQ